MEIFFQVCVTIDSAEITEFLLRRYGQLEVFYKMPLIDFFAFLKVARNREQDERVYMRWCAMLPSFVDNKFLDYNYFKELVTGSNIDRRPVEDIIAEIDKAHNKGN